MVAVVWVWLAAQARPQGKSISRDCGDGRASMDIRILCHGAAHGHGAFAIAFAGEGDQKVVTEVIAPHPRKAGKR